MTTGTNTATDLPQERDESMYPMWKVNLPYFVLAMIVVGQVVAAVDVMAGQAAYILANVAGIYHVFTLNRPMADKVKNVLCFGVTMSIILFKLIG